MCLYICEVWVKIILYRLFFLSILSISISLE
jgi:hypothetical protein